MLIKSKILNGYCLDGRDGKFGEIKEFYFDDQNWMVCYLVADTLSSSSGKQVLIPSHELIAVNPETKSVKINMTRQQIENCPCPDSDKPVSRQFERGYYRYFRWLPDWNGTFLRGVFFGVFSDPEKQPEFTERIKPWNPHLRSTCEVRDYHIQATDGEIGYVEDFIIDDRVWAIRYLNVNTHNWFLGRTVLVSSLQVTQVSWNDAKVFINLPREVIRRLPEYSKMKNKFF